MNNYMKLEIPAKSTNEAFVRATVGAFVVSWTQPLKSFQI